MKEIRVRKTIFMFNIKIRFMCDKKVKKIGVLLTHCDFERLLDKLEDANDYEYAKKFSGKKIKGVPLETVMAQIMKKR